MNKMTNKSNATILVFRRTFFVFLIVLGVWGMTGCKKKVHPPIENAFAIGYKNNIAYLINPLQEQFSLAMYDEIMPIFDTYIGVKKNGRYGFIQKNGVEVIAPIYQMVYPMQENMAVAVENNQSFIIDHTGKRLYTFPSGMTSTSSFSNHRLVVEQNGMYGYLIYHATSNTFALLETPAFDYAAPFIGDYAVVGKKDDSGIVHYNHVNKDGSLLLEEYQWDFADGFYNGWARVGNVKELTVSGKTTEQMMYHYINNIGNPLRGYGSNEILEYPYAKNFYDEMALVANYKFYDRELMYYKDYAFITAEGTNFLSNAFFYASGNIPKVFWPGQAAALKDTHVFRVGSNSGSWKIYYYKYTSNQWVFNNIPWNIDEKAQWLIDWANRFNTSIQMAMGKANAPYEMEEMTTSPHYTEQNPLTRVRIFGSNSYGIVKVAYNQTESKYEVSYIIDPIYDKIIY